jgi:hypothetical protein
MAAQKAKAVLQVAESAEEVSRTGQTSIEQSVRGLTDIRTQVEKIAEQISLLQTRPLGIKSVINPLRASGGADKEGRDLARENAPLSVMSLDRLVSVQDYADFARRFAGIAKAIATLASDQRRELVYLTIAGADDAPIDITSDLYHNLLDTLRGLGDADMPVRVDVRELKVLVLSAGIQLMTGYLWEPVAAAVRARLLDAFGFGRRALGQPALLQPGDRRHPRRARCRVRGRRHVQRDSRERSPIPKAASAVS